MLRRIIEAGGSKPISLQEKREDASKLRQEINQRSTKLRARLDAWENKKDITARDVMEILDLAFALTNNPAFKAAQEAMTRHWLDRGGLRRGGLKRMFARVRRFHHEPPERSCAAGIPPEPDNVSWYMETFDYNARQAAEHVVAHEGIPGTSFDGAVENVLRARKPKNQKAYEDERQQYWNDVYGIDEEKIKKLFEEKVEKLLRQEVRG
jgi:hypothetical protein